MNENRLIQNALLTHETKLRNDLKSGKWKGILREDERKEKLAEARQCSELAVTYGRKADAEG